MKYFSYLLVLTVVSVAIAKNPFVIEEVSSGSVVLSIEIDSVIEKKIADGGEIYDYISLPAFGQIGAIGAPLLPYHGVKILTSKIPNIKIEILESEVDIKKDHNVYPEQEPLWAVVGLEQITHFQMDTAIYNQNSFYPKNPITPQRTMTHWGVPVTPLSISPILYNPVTKELKVFKKLKVKVTFDAVSKSRVSKISSGSSKSLQNTVVNFSSDNKTRASINENYGKDILIITVPDFQEAADTLAVWQRMKGYDVEIEVQSSWSSSAVKTVAHNFYNTTTPKPGYLVLLGSPGRVAAESVSHDIMQPRHYKSDLYYTCTGDSGDYVPEYASGRISVTNATEAMNVVKKIIKYERTPPVNSAFYNTVLGSALFQDNGPNGVADRAFAENVELALRYLIDEEGKNGKRVYYSTKNQYQNISPKTWGNTYGAGGPVPSYLSGEWNGTAAQITAAINGGVSLVFHSDHGLEEGWGDPEYRISDLSNLSNGNLQPVVYSMDCLVGSYSTTSFADVIFRKKNAGAIGVVAASTLSFSGYNDAHMLGMIDACWPSEHLTLKTPDYPNPTVTQHEPIYTMGDVRVQGLARMTETWSSYAPCIVAHYEMYHYLGDPTMKLWVKDPETITILGSNSDYISVYSTTHVVRDLSIDTGFATLYNVARKKIVAKTSVHEGKINFAFRDSVGVVNDTVIMTITAEHHRPFFKTFVVSSTLGNIINNAVIPNSFVVDGSKICISKVANACGTIMFYNLHGKLVKHIGLDRKTSALTIDLKKMNLSGGMYLVEFKVNKFSSMEIVKIYR